MIGLWGEIKGYAALAGGVIIVVALAWLRGLSIGSELERAKQLKADAKAAKTIAKKRNEIISKSDKEIEEGLLKWTRRD